jgi:hypothetical protein
MRDFTKDEIKLLAECERMMDAGAPFVRLNNERIMCRKECMEEFGLERGQTITDTIFREILKWNIADCEAAIIERDMKTQGHSEK